MTLSKAQKIKLVIFDVDGVFTNATAYFNEQGEVILGFNIQDGFGITLLHRAEIITALISGRKSGAIQTRAAQLKIPHVYLGCSEKQSAYDDLKQKLQLRDEQIAYVGDDWMDMPIMQQVGLKVAVANAVPEVKEIANWITPHKGGKGAVRDVCELILKAQNRFEELLAPYKSLSNISK